MTGEKNLEGKNMHYLLVRSYQALEGPPEYVALSLVTKQSLGELEKVAVSQNTISGFW